MTDSVTHTVLGYDDTASRAFVRTITVRDGLTVDVSRWCLADDQVVREAVRP